MKKILGSVVLGAGLLLLAIVLNCGGGGGGGSNTPLTDTGTVNLSLTDPPICKNPNGSFDHIWVTITRVMAHVSEDADFDHDAGWINLVDLRDQPMQIDLLDLDSTTCLLTQLGSTSGLPAGHYQQIRVLLLSNNPKPKERGPSLNKCDGSGFNCVVPANGNGTPEELSIGSADRTGIKIPSGQIAHGKFVIPAGQSVDLNIDFDACRSIIRQGNGNFRLKPVLRASEVSLNKNAISGRVIDKDTKLPIPLALVAAEQKDSNNVDRIIVQKFTGPDGKFIFCPLPSGQTFDIVAVAITGQAAYNATVTLNVPVGTAMGDIPLVPESGLPAIIKGQVTTTTSNQETSADIALSALQATKPIGSGSSLIVTIPLLNGSTHSVTTESNSTNCPNGTDCANYELLVPSSNPKVGVFGQPYADPFDRPVKYWVNAEAFVPMSATTNAGKADCSPSSLPEKFDSSTALTVVDASGTLITQVTQDFMFKNCQ
jgi:hypothetical protein